MDNEKPDIGEEEFHFAEAEETSPYESAAAVVEPGSKLSKFNRRNILIAIGVIVVALSLYKLIGVFFGSDATKKTTATVTTPKTTTAPVQIQQPSFPVAQPTTQPQVTSPQIESISNEVAALSTSVGNLQNTINSMNDQLQSISSQLQQQQSALEALKPKPNARPRYTRKVVYRPKPKWYIQALIPGRAWLILPDGRTITVRVGSSLSGYGKIRAISVPKGIVNTSTGAILRYKSQ